MNDTRIREMAEALIEDDAVGVFDDSNSGQAAAMAAADLLTGWNTYDAPYQQKHAHEYQPYDVDEVIKQLQAWKAKGCPAPSTKTPAYDAEPPTKVVVGDRVFWTDPDGGIASGPGTVVRIDDIEPFDEDAIISLKMDDEGEVDCYLRELRPLKEQS